MSSPLYALARKWPHDPVTGRYMHTLYASYVAFLPLPPGWAWCE